MYIAWLLVCLSIFNMVLSLVFVSVYTMFWSCRWCLPPHLESCLSYLGSLFPSLRFGQFKSGFYWSHYQQYRRVSNSHRSSNWSCLPRCSQLGSLDGLTTCGLSSKPCLYHFESYASLPLPEGTLVREHNVVADSLANYILDWHIAHWWHENQTWFIVNKL